MLLASRSLPFVLHQPAGEKCWRRVLRGKPEDEPCPGGRGHLQHLPAVLEVDSEGVPSEGVPALEAFHLRLGLVRVHLNLILSISAFSSWYCSLPEMSVEMSPKGTRSISGLSLAKLPTASRRER